MLSNTTMFSFEHPFKYHMNTKSDLKRVTEGPFLSFMEALLFAQKIPFFHFILWSQEKLLLNILSLSITMLPFLFWFVMKTSLMLMNWEHCNLIAILVVSLIYWDIIDCVHTLDGMLHNGSTKLKTSKWKETPLSIFSVPLKQKTLKKTKMSF